MRSRVFVLFVTLLLLLGCHGKSKYETITIAVPYEFDTLDPHARNTLSNFAILSHFYEPLVETDAAMTIRPCLAKLWENPDALTWIFYLQPDVQFHSGRPLTSDDVVYSFRRLLDNPGLEMSGYLTDISDITAVGPHTVRVHTLRPMNILLNKLRFVPIIPQSSTPESLQRGADGTGPYALREWKKGESVRVVRNESYWRTKPDIREALFMLGQTPDKALADLQNNKCRFAQCNAKLMAEQITDFHVLRNDSLFLKFIGFDLIHDQTPYCSVNPNPFKNTLVRKAIHFALDRKTLTSKLTLYASPATQPLPPFVFGFNPRIQPAQFDPDQAISLLRQAGLPNGFEVTMHFRNNLEEAAREVKEQLARIGIRVQLQTLPAPEMLSALRKHQYSMFLASMGAPTGDASDILDSALHSPDPDRRFGVLNYGGYSNPDVDLAIEQSAQIQRMDARRDAIQQIMAMVMEDLPWIPLYTDQDVYLIDKAYLWKPRNDSFIFASEIKLR